MMKSLTTDTNTIRSAKMGIQKTIIVGNKTVRMRLTCRHAVEGLEELQRLINELEQLVIASSLPKSTQDIFRVQLLIIKKAMRDPARGFKEPLSTLGTLAHSFPEFSIPVNRLKETIFRFFN